MECEFHPSGLGAKYQDERYLKKKYGVLIQTGMERFLNAVLAAENAYDLKCLPQFFLEHKKGNLKAYYAVSLDKKKSKWRLLMQMLDDAGDVAMPGEDEKAFLRSIRRIRIMELSDHYGEY